MSYPLAMRPSLLPALTAVAVVSLALSGCSDSGGPSADDRPTPSPTAGTDSDTSAGPSPSPTPTPTDVDVADLAGGWMPADSQASAFYTLIIDENGDADSVGSPGFSATLGQDSVCFGSLEHVQRNQFQVDLDCSSLADLGGSAQPFHGTATLEPSPAIPDTMSTIMGCEEGPGMLLINWTDAGQDTLCWIGEADDAATES